MALSFVSFVSQQYKNAPQFVKKYHADFESFKNNYILSYGLTPWYESLRGSEISAHLCINIAKSLVIYGGRSANTIPMCLAQISRSYEIELPATEGLLTPEFWQELIAARQWQPITQTNTTAH